MKRLVLMVILALICGVVLTSCKNEDEKGFQVIEFECTSEVDNLAKELLVFISRGYFELVTVIKEESCVQKCEIKSKQLKTVIESLNIVSITKAFPDWTEADDVIIYDEYGRPIQKPEVDRIFKFLFTSEQEADEAILKLNALPEVVYAEKNGSVGFE